MVQGEERDAQGFTLIELSVVLTILGILLAIVAVTFLGQRTRADEAKAKSHVAEALKAQRVLYTDDQAYGTAAELEQVEPALTYSEDAVVAGQVYVKVEGQTVTLASRSTDGTCYWVKDTKAVAQYASGPCTAAVETLTFGSSW